MPQYKYRAFISYSHADEKWARWLHRSLETYRIPKRLIGQKTEFGAVPAKLAPVFRDREELASATDLGQKLTDALEGSATLIVICSRSSASSHWVNEEILAYKRLGRSNRIFSLIVDGEPYSSAIPGEEAQECFPEALRFQIDGDGELTRTQAEPIAADARPGKDGKSHAKIKLIAGMLGVGFDDLRQRELQRRNRRLAFISVSAVAGMVFAIGLATTAVIARNEAQEQRARAEKEAETARQTASFMIDLFDVSDPSEARGKSITAREILTNGAERIATDLNDQPLIQASLMDTIGKVYTSLGLYTDAGKLLEDALALRRQSPGIGAEAVVQSVFNLANVVTKQADYGRAETLYQEALSLLETDTGNLSVLHTDITAALAELYYLTGEYLRATPLLQQVYDERVALFGRQDPSVAEAIEELGLNLFDQGKLPEAEARLREALELRWETLGREPHPDTAENINNLALVLAVSGKRGDAEKLFLQALEMNRKLYGDSHPSIAMSLNNLAENYRGQNDVERAESMYLQAIDLQRQLLGDSHPDVALCMTNLGLVYQDAGDLEKAVSIGTEALAIQRESLGDSHPKVAVTLDLLGRWQTGLGHLERAESLLREALDMQLELLEPNHPDTALTRLDYAETLMALGKYEEAHEQAEAAQAELASSLGEDHWLTAVAGQILGGTLHGSGDFEGAEALILSSFRRLDADPGVRPVEVVKTLERLITLYTDWGKEAEASKYQHIKAQRSAAG